MTTPSSRVSIRSGMAVSGVPGGSSITLAQLEHVEGAKPSTLAHYRYDLARAAATGLHRDPRRPAIAAAEQIERVGADEQDAALYVVAAFTGLRLGELLALRWRNGEARALSDGVSGVGDQFEYLGRPGGERGVAGVGL